MGFFGEIIGSNKREVAIPDGFSLTLLTACLDLQSAPKTGVVTLWMQPKAENSAFIIAHFDGKSLIQSNLMQELATEDGPIELWTSGGGEVHLTGRWGYAEEEDHDEHGEFSDEEEGEEEEEGEYGDEDADTRIDRAIRAEEEAKLRKKKRMEQYLGEPLGNNKRFRSESPAVADADADAAAEDAVEPSPFEEAAAVLKSPFKPVTALKASPFEEPAESWKSPFPPARGLDDDEGEWEMLEDEEGLRTPAPAAVPVPVPAPAPAAVTISTESTITPVSAMPEPAEEQDVRKKKKRKQKVGQNDQQEKLERREAKAAEEAELDHYNALVAPVKAHSKLEVEKKKQRGVWKVKPIDGEGVLVPQLKQVVRPSGILVTDYVIGAGKEPKGGSRVGITYEGMFPDGTIFDKNVKRSKPLVFRKGAGEVVRGLDYGLEGMHVGGSREVVVPAALG